MYFGFSPANHGSLFAPNSICSTCSSNLSRWKAGKRQMAFGKPTIWLEVFNHQPDCYFCNFDPGQTTSSNRN